MLQTTAHWQTAANWLKKTNVKTSLISPSIQQHICTSQIYVDETRTFTSIILSPLSTHSLLNYITICKASQSRQHSQEKKKKKTPCISPQNIIQIQPLVVLAWDQRKKKLWYMVLGPLPTLGRRFWSSYLDCPNLVSQNEASVAAVWDASFLAWAHCRAFSFLFHNTALTSFNLCVSQTWPLRAHEKVQSGSQTAVGWEQTVLIVCNGETELLPAIKGG